MPTQVITLKYLRSPNLEHPATTHAYFSMTRVRVGNGRYAQTLKNIELPYVVYLQLLSWYGIWTPWNAY